MTHEALSSGHNEQVTATEAPTSISDRPLGVVDLLDGAFHALRQRPLALVLAVAWIAIPGALVQLYLDTRILGTARPSLGNGFGVPIPGVGQSDGEFFSDSILFRLAIGWLITAIAGVPVARIVGGWGIGLDESPRAAISYTVRRLPVIVAVFVMAHVVTIIGWVFCLIPGLIFMGLYSLLSPVIAMEEDSKPIAAMRRSWRLARPNLSAVLGLIISLFLTGAIIQGGPLFLISVFDGLPERAGLVIGTTLSLVAQLVLLPLNGAAMCLLYLDARYRSEGLDLELRTRQVFTNG